MYLIVDQMYVRDLLHDFVHRNCNVMLNNLPACTCPHFDGSEFMSVVWVCCIPHIHISTTISVLCTGIEYMYVTTIFTRELSQTFALSMSLSIGFDAAH